MTWQSQLQGDPIPWLLEREEPGPRYLTIRDVMGATDEDKELKSARKAAHKEGPIAAILSRMNEEGFWARPGTGYGPKYKSTVWALILLAQLGATIKEDKRILKACNYLLEHALTEGGQFSAMTNASPSGTIDCLQGNLLWSLMELGCDDPRLGPAYEWMARTTTGEGIARMKDKHAPVRYYAGKCGPNFACGANNKLPCAWGGCKVLLAFGKLPPNRRTALIKRAIQQGVDFFFTVDPVTANYPNGWAAKPSGNWWKFGFPVFYVTDILQIAEAMAGLGLAKDPRLVNTVKFIHKKQNEQGRWLLEYDYTGKTWQSYGKPRLPNKWVTLRALRVLQAAN